MRNVYVEKKVMFFMNKRICSFLYADYENFTHINTLSKYKF